MSVAEETLDVVNSTFRRTYIENLDTDLPKKHRVFIDDLCWNTQEIFDAFITESNFGLGTEVPFEFDPSLPENSFQFVATCSTGDQISVTFKVTHTMHQGQCGRCNQTGIGCEGTRFEHSTSHQWGRKLSQKQKNYLEDVLFLSMLSGFVDDQRISWRDAALLCNYLQVKYSRKPLFYLKICMVAARVYAWGRASPSVPMSDAQGFIGEGISTQFYKAGEALEGLGEFDHAAEVYDAIVTHYDEWESPTPIKPKALYCTAAGIACKRNGDFAKAEAHHVNAIQSDTAIGIPPLSATSLNAFFSLARCYELWIGLGSSSGDGSGGGPESVEANLAASCTVAIIATANVGYNSQMVIHGANDKLCGILKYGNKPAKCIKAMKQAARLDGVEAFRKRMAEDRCPKINGFGGMLERNKIDPAAQKKQYLKVTKEQLQESNCKVSEHKSCSHCNKVFKNANIKQCPCRHARYCGLECQKKDWKLHKNVHKMVMAKAEAAESENYDDVD